VLIGLEPTVGCVLHHALCSERFCANRPAGPDLVTEAGGCRSNPAADSVRFFRPSAENHVSDIDAFRAGALIV